MSEPLPNDTPVIPIPISVPASPVPEQLLTLVRYALVAAGGYLVARGILAPQLRDMLLDPKVVNALAALILTSVPTLLGLLKVRKNNTVQQNLADRLPDSIAKVE